MDAETRTSATTGLVRLPVEDVQSNWWWLKPRLDVVAKRSGGHWIAEDVYLAAKTGAATIFLIEGSDAERMGILVLNLHQDYDAKILSVWVCYSEGKEDIIAGWEKALAELARSLGAKRLVFTSARNGWGRRLAVHGWREAGRIYEREV